MPRNCISEQLSQRTAVLHTIRSLHAKSTPTAYTASFKKENISASKGRRKRYKNTLKATSTLTHISRKLYNHRPSVMSGAVNIQPKTHEKFLTNCFTHSLTDSDRTAERKICVRERTNLSVCCMPCVTLSHKTPRTCAQ